MKFLERYSVSRRLIIVATLTALGGCAAGNKYDYQSARVGLPVVGTDEIGVAVVDRRPYVVSGNKKPNFVGLQRGGFGNPFDVTTTSGNPMAADMQAALARALDERGYEVTELYFSSPDDSVVAQVIKENGARRNVLLMLNEWKTDAVRRFGLTYDILLKIVDENYVVLAQASAKAVKEVLGGAGMAGQNSRTAAQAFEVKVSRLFNDPEIRRALESD